MLSLPFPVVPHQEWCKFDLEWALYKERFEVADKSMSDSKPGAWSEIKDECQLLKSKYQNTHDSCIVS